MLNVNLLCPAKLFNNSHAELVEGLERCLSCQMKDKRTDVGGLRPGVGSF